MTKADDPTWVLEGLKFWEGQLNKAQKRGNKTKIQRAKWEYAHFLRLARRLNLV